MAPRMRVVFGVGLCLSACSDGNVSSGADATDGRAISPVDSGGPSATGGAERGDSGSDAGTTRTDGATPWPDSGKGPDVQQTSYPGIPSPPLIWWDTAIPPATHTLPAGDLPSELNCGDVIEWTGNTGRLDMDMQGCPDNPIWLVGKGVVATADNGNPHSISGSNLIVIGIDFRGQDGTLSLTGQRLVLRGISVTDPDRGNGSALFIGGSHIVIAESVIGPSGDYIDSGGPDVDHHCIKTDGAAHVWILNSEIKECQGDGLQIGDQNSDGGHHIFIAGNDIHDNCQTGIWLKRGADVVAVKNRIWGHTQGCQSSPVGAGAQYENSWFTLAYNEFWDNGGGIQIQTAEGGPRYFIGNVIRNCTEDAGGNAHAPHGITNRAGGNETYLLHNTIIDCSSALGIVNGAGTTVHGNLYGRGALDVEGALAEDSANLSGDGQLDESWTPEAGSAAVDAAGMTHPAYQLWESHYGLPITHGRPLGVAWDIGARERPHSTPQK